MANTCDMTIQPCNILILCTGNSARSILAEAINNHRGGARVRVDPAGSHPKSEPNPIGLTLLQERGFDTSAFR